MALATISGHTRMPCARWPVVAAGSVALLPSQLLASIPYMSNTAESLVPAVAWLGLITSDLDAWPLVVQPATAVLPLRHACDRAAAGGQDRARTFQKPSRTTLV